VRSRLGASGRKCKTLTLVGTPTDPLRFSPAM
jgi:hypothetical protein